MIPADLLILHTSDEKGTAYVETKNLDGETNLKIKSANKEMQARFKDVSSLASIEGEINCEGPNNAIYNFEGNVNLNGKMISLNIDNLLLRGSSLRNTEYVYCLAVYQGHDTKIMRNSAHAKYKFSKLDLMTNKLIALTLLTQVVLALIAAGIGAQWNAGNGSLATYMGNELKVGAPESFGLYLAKQLGTWILIFTNFVPISLMVTLELVKFWQGMFMSNDFMMYDEEQDMEMKAQSSNLNEELGQIEYVFSDKTGTLTCNIMEFKKFAAGTLPYGLGTKPDLPQLSNVNFHDPTL